MHFVANDLLTIYRGMSTVSAWKFESKERLSNMLKQGSGWAKLQTLVTKSLDYLEVEQIIRKQQGTSYVLLLLSTVRGFLLMYDIHWCYKGLSNAFYFELALSNKKGYSAISHTPENL